MSAEEFKTITIGDPSTYTFRRGILATDMG